MVPVRNFLSSDVSAPSTTQAPTPVNLDDGEKNEDQRSEDQKRHARKAKRMATNGTRPSRPISGDSERGRAGDLGTAAGTGLTDTRVARRHPSNTCTVLFPSEEGFQRL
jgi:hypothetical protein